MTVLRHYYISDELDDLETVETELEGKGIETPQIHVLSLDDTAVENHVHLHDVTSFMKSDVIRSGEWGLLIGVIGAVLVLGGAYLFNLTDTAAGWIPFIFLAIIVLGFSTWEGGFIGIQRRNKHFERFEDVLKSGKHVFFVDVSPDQEGVLEQVVKAHPGLQIAGTERGTPQWIMKGQKRIPHLLRETLP
jgi:hypothetical protein